MKTISRLLLLAVSLFSFCESAISAHVTVVMSDFAFTPTNVTIGIGDSITWTNSTIDKHTTTSGDTMCNPSTLWDSMLMNGHATFTFTFTNFAAGTYTYICTNHCARFGMMSRLIITNPAPGSPPSINLDSPANGSKFLAPANVPLQTTVVPGSGTVTNVQFLSGNVPLGNLGTAPFNLTVSNLAAGNYVFSAIAMDSLGLGATSSVVNVFVLTNATLVSPRFSNGEFLFTLQGIAGQTYITEGSSNLLNWSGISTNLAPADTFDVSDPSPSNPYEFYRARQDLF